MDEEAEGFGDEDVLLVESKLSGYAVIKDMGWGRELPFRNLLDGGICP